MRYSYDLFCQRKGFTLQNYFVIYPQGTYDDFTTFLRQRNVAPITEERFNASRKKYLEGIKPQEPTIEVVLEEEQVEEVKPKRTRRRRSAKKNTSDIS
jgi:hypothetical protein